MQYANVVIVNVCLLGLHLFRLVFFAWMTSGSNSPELSSSHPWLSI